MLRRYTNNLDFDLYRNAADKLDIGFVPLLGDKEPLGYFSLGDRRLYVQGSKLGVNDSVATLIARNRRRTHQLLEKFRLPSPRAILVKSNGSIERISGRAGKLRRPFVVKPLRGSLGRGVSIKLDGPDEVAEAANLARKTSRTILIEEFIAGADYRISVFDGEVIDVLQRVPAYVIGDGKSTIRTLIGEKNERRKIIGLRRIPIDRELRRFLGSQKLDLKNVPESGRKISLRLNCNMRSGGESRRLDIRREVHPDNIRMFADATREMGLRLARMDFLTPDISKSHKAVRCAISEVSGAPTLDVHYFADFAMNNVVGETILARLLRGPG